MQKLDEEIRRALDAGYEVRFFKFKAREIYVRVSDLSHRPILNIESRCSSDWEMALAVDNGRFKLNQIRTANEKQKNEKKPKSKTKKA